MPATGRRDKRDRGSNKGRGQRSGVPLSVIAMPIGTLTTRPYVDTAAPCDLRRAWAVIRLARRGSRTAQSGRIRTMH